MAVDSTKVNFLSTGRDLAVAGIGYGYQVIPMGDAATLLVLEVDVTNPSGAVLTKQIVPGQVYTEPHRGLRFRLLSGSTDTWAQINVMRDPSDRLDPAPGRLPGPSGTLSTLLDENDNVTGGTKPTTVADGFALNGTKKLRISVVAVNAGATITSAVGKLLGFIYIAALGEWARAPELDLMQTEATVAGQRVYSWAPRVVEVAADRIDYVASGVAGEQFTVSAGTQIRKLVQEVK